MNQVSQVARTRPPRYVNCFRITLERGDGECIDLGELPDLDNPVSMARFIVRLSEARSRGGHYDFRDRMQWFPSELDFHIDAPHAQEE